MANFENAIMRDTRANQPAAGIAGRLYFVTDELVWERDSGSVWEDVSTGGAADAADVTYTPLDPNDWDYLEDPGDSGDALDQLAARTTVLEAGGAGAGYDYILIQDQESANTAGGTFTSGAWQTRVLNTEVSDAGGHASLASNQITLAAGTYDCDIQAPAYKVDAHKAILYNVTDGADILVGSSGHTASSTSNSVSHSFIKGRFVLAAPKVLEVRHRCQTTGTTTGFGVANNLDSKVEIYTSAEFRKVA